MTLSIWLKIWLFLCRFSVYWFLRLQIYRAKSWFHQRIYDRKYDNEVMPTFGSVHEIFEWMKANFEWKRDGLSEFFDAVCTPQKVQAVKKNSPHGNDCDEEARWVSYVMLKSIEVGSLKEKDIKCPYFFTVTWMEPSGKTNGHNVCLINYTDGQWAYMDYYMPSVKFSTPLEVANLVRKEYAGWDTVGHGKSDFVGIVCGYADTITLRPVKTIWG